MRGNPSRLGTLPGGTGDHLIMSDEFGTTEVRQADRRKMNMRALFWGVPAAFIILAVIFALWAKMH